MKLQFILPVLIFIIFLIFLIRSNGSKCVNTNNNNVFDLHVYDWGAQVAIKNIMSILNHGDVYNTKFKWSKKPIKYSGFYHLDTGSHLLVDMIMMNRTDVINNLKKYNR